MSTPLVQNFCHDLRRGLITSGEFEQRVNLGEILGAAWNPAVMHNVVAGSIDYDAALEALAAQGVTDGRDILETLAIEDIQHAADILDPVYQRSNRRDGHVSLDLSPFRARDTTGLIAEALRLNRAVARDNLMIRLPATPDGIEAIHRLVSRGISVDVTWIFSPETHAAVLDAYLAGLEMLVRSGGDPKKVSSVAHLSIDAVDSAIDLEIVMALDSTRDRQQRSRLKCLLGKTAIAHAKLAAARLREVSESDRWQALECRGAQLQRLLCDDRMCEERIAPLDFDEHSAESWAGRWKDGCEEAREQLDEIRDLGISMADVAETLLEHSVLAFSDTFGKLASALETKCDALVTGAIAQVRYALGDERIAATVTETLASLRRNGLVREFWSGGKDPHPLGWLHAIDAHRNDITRLRHFVHDVTGAGFEHVVVLGDRESNRCVEMLLQTFGREVGFPELRVLDSTAPETKAVVEAAIDPSRTLFVVASNAADPTETLSVMRDFFEKVREKLGAEAGSRFVAITDRGTPLHRFAKAERFDHIWISDPAVAALSNATMLPAALMGIDVAEFLGRAQMMSDSCAPCVPIEANPAVVLGVIVARMAQAGRNKMTLLASPGIARLGGWLEHVVANLSENGTEIVPVIDEKVQAPDAYASDRLFVYARLGTDSCERLDAAVDDLESAGHPVVRLSIDEALDLGRLLLQWMFATTVAGAVLKLAPIGSMDDEAAQQSGLSSFTWDTRDSTLAL